MEHDNALLEDASELVTLFDNGPPDDSALTRLRHWIEKVRESLCKADIQNGELTLLRADISARIAGMAKAIAVARNSDDRLAEAADLVAELNQMSAADLIATYGKVSARFRDTFRSSFVPPHFQGSSVSRRNTDVSDFK